MNDETVQELMILLRIGRKWGVVSETDGDRIQKELEESRSEALGEDGSSGRQPSEGSAPETGPAEENPLRRENSAGTAPELLPESQVQIRSADY